MNFFRVFSSKRIKNINFLSNWHKVFTLLYSKSRNNSKERTTSIKKDTSSATTNNLVRGISRQTGL